MTVIKLEEGQELQVGDKVRVDTRMSKYTLTVTRLTKTMAIAIHPDNDKAVWRFPRTYDWNFENLPREKWNTCTYTVYREVKE